MVHTARGYLDLAKTEINRLKTDADDMSIDELTGGLKGILLNVAGKTFPKRRERNRTEKVSLGSAPNSEVRDIHTTELSTNITPLWKANIMKILHDKSLKENISIPIL